MSSKSKNNFLQNNGANLFKEFFRCYGSPSSHSPAISDEIVRCQDVLPQQLLNFWQQQGFGNYADGLLWTHPPSIFNVLIEEWTGLSPNQAGLIFRSSFGDFCVWNKDRAYLLDIHVGRVDELTRDIEFLFNYILCREQFLRDVLQLELHSQSVDRLGQLNPDECFAFVPARALGGSGTIETVQRVSIQEHLALLAQLVGPVTVI